jgi:hypothetical protein
MNSDEISMVRECVDLYNVTALPDGKTEITIIVPARFSALWLTNFRPPDIGPGFPAISRTVSRKYGVKRDRFAELTRHTQRHSLI